MAGATGVWPSHIVLLGTFSGAGTNFGWGVGGLPPPPPPPRFLLH